MYCNEEYIYFLRIVKYSFKSNEDYLCNFYYIETKKKFFTEHSNELCNVMGIPLQCPLHSTKQGLRKKYNQGKFHYLYMC